MQEFLGQDDPITVRLMSGFGGGIGGSGSICGAIVGGVGGLSLSYGRGSVDERESRKLFPLCTELYRRFQGEIETSRFCREITGIDFADPEQAKAFSSSPEKRARCARLVGETANLVCEMLAREKSAETRDS